MMSEELKTSRPEAVIQTITSGQPDYPALLKEIKGYPKQLYCIGDTKILKKRAAAVVGSRKTTQYGRSTAYVMAKRLGERDIAVVSGMAKGIDTCAHQGALKSGGSTIAVLGCGVDMCYPRGSEKLKEEIETKGLVISEYPPGAEPKKFYFPQRNRIISGLAEITAVIQAGNNSGALITAELAAEQGREVYAVPGNIDSEYNFGSNKLIKEGAVPVTCIQDILEAMGVTQLSEKEAERMLSEAERNIYALLVSHGEMSIDELCMAAAKPAGYVNGIVTVMEMKGLVFSALGKIFIAKA